MRNLIHGLTIRLSIIAFSMMAASCGKSIKEGDLLYVADNEITQKSKGAGIKTQPNAASPTVRIAKINTALGKATGKIVVDKDKKFIEFTDPKNKIFYVVADVVKSYSPGSEPPNELFVRFEKYSFKCVNTPYWSMEKGDMDVKTYTWDVFYPQFYSTQNPDAFAAINKDIVPKLTQEDCVSEELRYEVNHFNPSIVGYRSINVFPASMMKGSFQVKAFVGDHNIDVETGKEIKLRDVIKDIRGLNQAAKEAFRKTGLYNTPAEEMPKEMMDCLLDNYVNCDWETSFAICTDTLKLMFDLWRYDCETIGANSGPFYVPVPLTVIENIVKPTALKYFERGIYRVENPYAGQNGERQ